MSVRPRLPHEQSLARLDRRIVYLGLLLISLAPLVAGWNLPLYISEPPKLFFRTIEELPPEKVVVISSNWDAGTQAENSPQMMALVRHLIRRNLKFVLFSIGYPNSPQLAHDVVLRAIELEQAGGRYRYGEQWANLGYKLPEDAWIRSLSSDFEHAFPADWRATPLADLPVMRGLRKFGPDGQISMLIDITGSNTIERWYQFLSPTRVRLGVGATAVMAPEQYPYLDSGQLSGLLTGMKGGAEYEQLIQAPAFGTRAMAGQSFAHAYIFLLVLLGNLPQLARLRLRRGKA